MATQISPPTLSVVGLSKTILLQSASILKQHYKVFIFISLVFSLPLSLLTSSLVSASHPIKSRILLLHFIASQSDLGVEASQAWKEARVDARLLFCLKLKYFLPCSLLSLATAVATVSSVAGAVNHRPVDVTTTMLAVRNHWFLPIVTSICNYTVLIVYSTIPRMMMMRAGGELLRSIFWIMGLGIEVYLVTLMGMAIVLSIVEDLAGWDAMFKASKLIEGKRLCGLILVGLGMLTTGVISRRLENSLDGDRAMWTRFSGWMTLKAKREPWRWEWPGLVFVYAGLVVWSYILSAIFYCECRKRQTISKDVSEEELVDKSQTNNPNYSR